MGYFTAAFCFNQQPNWEPLRSLGFQLALSGYRHMFMPLWLLGVRDAARKGSGHPFADFIEPPSYRRADRKVGEIEGTLIGGISLAAGVVADNRHHLPYITSALALGFEIHHKLGIATCFLAADDEGLDIGVELKGGNLVHFRMHGIYGLVTSDGACIVVEPRVVVEDDDEWGPDPGSLERAARHPLIHLREPRRVTEDEIETESASGTYCSAAAALWPSDWPDPKAAIGLGSANMWSNFPTDFQLAFRVDRHARPAVV